jgi:hypothetical protein
MAADSPAPPDQSGWTEALWNLPLTRWLVPLLSSPTIADPVPPAGICKFGPLPPITDPEAMAFEQALGPTTTGLVPAMTRALARFEELVSSVGGTFVLKSAYRPTSYQSHLQQVWLAWMQLRNDREPGCQLLRAEVRAEFMGHDLIETQKPVTSSDHTRGLAFDATVLMPRIARLKRRLVSLDRLALIAGIMRPDIGRDPVHYKLMIARASHVSSAGL